jgi:hypothetical protein
MGQLLVVLFFLALFVVAPLKAAILFSCSILLATLVVQATTATISRVNVSLSESFKAIVLASLFSAIAIFTMISFMSGAPRGLIGNPTGFALLGLQYGAYVLGFRIALGLTFIHAAIVAVVSTLITSTSIWFIAKMAQHAT